MRYTVLRIGFACLVCLAFLLSAFATLADGSSSKKIFVSVSVDPAILPDNSADWPLYVYAAKPNTRLPLSSFKAKLGDLPLEVTLDESMYLLPHLTLKDADQVVIVAKASKSQDPHKKSPEDLIEISPVVNFEKSAHLSLILQIKHTDSSVATDKR